MVTAKDYGAFVSFLNIQSVHCFSGKAWEVFINARKITRCPWAPAPPATVFNSTVFLRPFHLDVPSVGVSLFNKVYGAGGQHTTAL